EPIAPRRARNLRARHLPIGDPQRIGAEARRIADAREERRRRVHDGHAPALLLHAREEWYAPRMTPLVPASFQLVANCGSAKPVLSVAFMNAKSMPAPCTAAQS